jgi:transcription elongation factor Elf1
MKKADSLREIFKNTKRRKPTQIFCPRCCSPKIQLSTSLDVWLTPKQYYCENCGYLGIIVMELEEAPELNKEEPELDNAESFEIDEEKK